MTELATQKEEELFFDKYFPFGQASSGKSTAPPFQKAMKTRVNGSARVRSTRGPVTARVAQANGQRITGSGNVAVRNSPGPQTTKIAQQRSLSRRSRS